MNNSISDSNENFSVAAAYLFRESLDKFGGQWRRIVSNSMFPFIAIGDWIWIESLKQRQIKRGDIVVFYRGNDFIVHRVLHVNKTKNLVIEKGDMIPAADTVAVNNVLGKVTKIKKGETERDLSGFRMKVLNRLYTIRSSAQLFWHMHIENFKVKTAASMPKIIRKPAHVFFSVIRNAFYPETSFREYPWYERTENIVMGDQSLSVSIAPKINDVGIIVRTMREKNIKHAVLCIFINSATKSLLRYFTTIENIVVLMNKKGVVIDIVHDRTTNSDTSAKDIMYALLLNPESGIPCGIGQGSTMHMDGVI